MEFLNRLLIVTILVISTAPLYAQRQQQNVVKLKADARNLVGIIGGDKAKTQAYCQILDLTAQLDRANQEKDSRKMKALSQKMDQLQKQLGPEFVGLVKGLNRIDLNSPDGREILSIIKTLDQSCPD
jgi:chromosome segregation ATPase